MEKIVNDQTQVFDILDGTTLGLQPLIGRVTETSGKTDY